MPQLLDKETIERIHESAVDILSTIGVGFGLAEARDLLQKHGAEIKGKQVCFPASLVEGALALMPKCDSGPAGRKRLVAASPFSNSPTIIDDKTGEGRRGTIEDVVKMYQLAETSGLYESVNPGVVDPEGIDSDDSFLAQIAMLLKYSDKFPNLGFCATKSNTENGDVYTSAKRAVQLIKEIKGSDKDPVMGQGICPISPLAYDEDGLINLTVLAEEDQGITIFPCTLSFMTGPESLTGIVIHDLAVALAGAVYVQLLKPGTKVGFSSFSTMTDMRTMQPCYGSPEYLHVQVMFYEVCRHLGMDCGLCGCFSDGIRNNYQGGFESCLTAMAPFSITDVNEVWCYPGHMAAFAGGSFNKLIFDEELMISCNRLLGGLSTEFDPLLKDKLAGSLDAGSFLTIGDVGIYRKEQRITKIFDKRGIVPGHSSSGGGVDPGAENAIKRRCGQYTLPERSKTQKALLSKYLPGLCRY